MMNVCFPGIDIGGSGVKFGLLDNSLNVLGKGFSPIVHSSPYETLLGAKSKILEMCSDLNVTPIHVGIACPGPIDFDTDSLGLLPNLPQWRGFEIVSRSREIFSLPVVLENDANAAGIAEAKLGAGKNCKLMILLTLGTGVGGALVSEGKLIKGATGAAGEIGHIHVSDNPIPCGCGNTGCLETMVGKAAIIRQYNQYVTPDRAVRNIPELVSRLGSGDSEAYDCFSYVGRTIGSTLGSLVNVLNPDCIVIGGGISNAGDPLLSCIALSMESTTIPSQRGIARVLPAKLGNDAGFIGASILAREAHVLSD